VAFVSSNTSISLALVVIPYMKNVDERKFGENGQESDFNPDLLKNLF
jgi:hypothetical protein